MSTGNEQETGYVLSNCDITFNLRRSQAAKNSIARQNSVLKKAANISARKLSNLNR
jgi:hypothetical protein